MRFLLVLAILGFSCKAVEPTNVPDETCKASCKRDLTDVCNEAACERGCLFIMDRILERETKPLFTCMKSRKKGCNDAAWATCAVRVGPHLDGGPPGPPAPNDDIE